MEITFGEPRPRRTARRRVNALAGFVAVVALAFLVPAACGLERSAVSDSPPDSYPVGTLLLSEDVPAGSVRVGDVIALSPPPGSGVTGPLVRRVDEASSGSLVVGDIDAPEEAWTVPTGTRVERVVVDIPYLGWPFVALGDRATRFAVIGTPAALVAGYVLVELVGTTRRRRSRLPDGAAIGVPAQRRARSGLGKHPDGVF